ncbi:MAG: tetratricopeptide repeat protein, partial [Gammaproteobacteria bacterium]|nr:tetratricopeptide repeat protein [Gammaproteobacteria bacterium]
MSDPVPNASRTARWHRRALRAFGEEDLEAADRACRKVLALDPEHADANFLLAACDLRRGHPIEALPRFDRAIAVEPQRADYWAHYAHCLTQLGRQTEAIDAVERAASCRPEDAGTLDTLGTVLALVGRHRDAAEQFAAATERAPKNARFLYNRAIALKNIGDLQDAEQAFEKVLELDPDYLLAHVALAENFAAPGQTQRIRRLEVALETIHGNVNGELLIRQALARLLEADGRYSEAFVHFERGRRAKKAASGYTIDEDRKIFSAIEDLFSSDSAAVVDPGQGADSAAPIFVMGMPRTGTTLVDRILSSHSAVTSGGELNSMAQSVWEAGGHRGTIINPDSWPQALVCDPRRIGERYLEHAATIVGSAERYVDKWSLNFFLIGFIRRALPKAKIICLRRGALDTCLANFRHLFALNFSGYRYALTLEDTAEYFVLFERLMGHWDSVFPGGIYHLWYENLVDDFDSEIARLLEYLELPHEDSVRRFHENSAPVATASAVQVRKPLYRSSIGAWRRYQRELE